MALNLAFLPDAVAGVIQDGILERKLYQSMRPMLLWRGLCSQERHPGQVGEKVTKTRSGLIQPDTAKTAKRTPGQDPGVVTRSMEQFSYQLVPYGKGIDIHLPASWLAQENKFLDDTGALTFHAAQTMGRICRDKILAAYGGGDTFTTDNPGSVTSVKVKDCTGFDTVLVNGTPTPVSATNTLPITIAGTAKLVTACVADDGSSPPSGPGTLTISVAMDYAQNDRVLRDDAPRIIRQASRATDQLIVAGDTPTIVTFREAAAYLRTHNVPGIDGVVGGLYGCFVDPHVENALFADDEFHDAIQATGLTGPFADGAIGDYAGIRFIRNTEMPVLADDADYQAHIHRSLVFGADVCIEAFVPESEFQRQVVPEGIVTANHYKTALDPQGVMTLVIRAPLDRAGEIVSASWLANADYCVPTDAKALTGSQRVKRAVVVHTAGPAA
jgi:N4-gp56 family major capsid protein